MFKSYETKMTCPRSGCRTDHTTKSKREGMMRVLVAVVLVLSCGLCWAEDTLDGRIKGRVVSNEQALTAEQAADLVTDFEGDLRLRGLTSIDKSVAKELVKAKGDLYLKGLTSIDKAVAKELAKYEGALLYLHGRTSIDELGLTYLKLNPNIHLPEKYRD